MNGDGPPDHQPGRPPVSVCGLGRGTDHSIPAPAPLTVYWLYQQRDEHSREEPERSDPVNPFMLYTHLLPPKPVPTLSRKVLKLMRN